MITKSRTSLSLANALRTLKAYAQAVQTQIGVGLASALRHAVVGLNQMMKYVLKAAQAFATFMQTIFGKYKGGASGIAMEGLGDAADYADDLSSSADSAADGLGDAADSARQLKKDLSVLPFDELNQLNKDREETSSGSGTGGSGSGGIGGAGLGDGLLDWDSIAEDSGIGEIPEWISRWGKRIRKAFDAKDWKGLGKEIADGLNTGIEKIYKALDPEIVKQKVFPFIDAFTTTFNSFVENFKFDMLGRTIGRGINDIVMILERAITGIEWRTLGQQLASGLNGLIDEVDFKALGNMLGSGFMIVWNTLNGFVHDFDWARLGEQLANGLNGFFDRVSFSTIADTLATGLNGVFESLAVFTATFDWQGFADNVAAGIEKFLTEFDWVGNAEKLSDFLTHLCDALSSAIDDVSWEDFGTNLALALQRLPWSKMLHLVGKVIVDVFGGILEGMGATPAGRFARAIIAGIVGFRIGGKLLPFVNKICEGLTGQKATSLLSTAIQKLIGNGFAGLTSSTIGATGAFAALVLALAAVGREIESLQETSRGGNGMLTSMGTAVQDLIDRLTISRDITSDQSDELFRLKESAEESGASTSEVAVLIAEKLNEWGVSADVARNAVDSLTASGKGQREEMEALSQAFAEYDDQVKVAAGDIDMTSVSFEEGFGAIHSALVELSTGTGEFASQYSYILDEFIRTQSSAATAQDAYNGLKVILEEFGIGVEDINEILAREYPEAMQEMTLSTTDSGEIVKTVAEDMAQATEDSCRRRENAEKHVGEAVHNAAVQNTQELINETKAAEEEARKRAGLLEDWKNDVQSFHDSVLTNLQGIGAGWGTLGAEQEDTLASMSENLETSLQSQRTAAQNMHDLYELIGQDNRTDLDKSIVQAILEQIDPSSNAMTELIRHMGANDTEWDTFHSQIQESLNLENDIQKTAEDMTTAFAEKTAPAFVEIGENFETKGGEIGECIIDGVAGGVYDNVDDAIEACESTAEKMQEAWKSMDDSHSPSKVYEGFARNQILGLVQGLLQNQNEAVKAIETVTKAMQEKMKELPDKIKEIGENTGSSFTSGLKDGFGKIDEVLSNLSSNLRTTLGEIDLFNTGKGVGVTFGNGLGSGFEEKIGGAISDARSALVTGLGGIDLYNTGVGVGTTFGNGIASGISSIHIPLPHMYVAYWQQVNFGDGGYMYYPNFGLSWYRQGGLFMGGNGQMIGIAEDGRDEAVLPLEDRRAMARIGSAIADAGGTGNSEEMVDRIAERLADIIMMRQDSEPDPIFNIEVRTENDEVLARAVSRGQQKLDYRNNPTPRMAY